MNNHKEVLLRAEWYYDAHYVTLVILLRLKPTLTTPFLDEERSGTITSDLTAIHQRWQRLWLTSNKICGKQKGKFAQNAVALSHHDSDLRQHYLLMLDEDIGFDCKASPPAFDTL
jgi:hypothetical protein